MIRMPMGASSPRYTEPSKKVSDQVMYNSQTDTSQRRTRPRQAPFNPGDLLIMSIPALNAVSINLFGQLYGSDLISLLLLPWLMLLRGKRLLDPFPRMILLLGIVWFLGQILTDNIRGTNFDDYSRRWANIFFFLTNFSTIYLLLIVARRRLVFFAIGIAIGILAGGMISPNLYEAGQPWKFGYGVSLLWFAPLLGVYAMSRKTGDRSMAAAIMVFAGLFYVIMGSRSLGGVCVMAGALLIGQGVVARGGNRLASQYGLPFAIVGILMSGLLPLQLWSFAAGSGILGEYQKQKYEVVAGSGLIGIIAGGRSEAFTSTRAIADSPIIGHGSWARDRQYMIDAIARSRAAGIQPLGNAEFNDLIPTHSHLFGSWVEGGIGGGIFWIFVMALAMRALMALLSSRDSYSPLLAVSLLLLAWDILFSPFSGDRRCITPFLIMCAHYVLTNYKKPQRPKANNRRPRYAPSEPGHI